MIVRAPLWGRVIVALLGAMTLAITTGLAIAGRSEEITIAVGPLEMRFPPFQGLAGLFPNFTLWTTETLWLSIFWLAIAALATGATVWSDELPRRARLWLRSES